jgi:hypothetical protein
MTEIQHNELTEKEINRAFISFSETSSTAMDALKEAGFMVDRRRAIAEVLRERTVMPPSGFPCSHACVAYGKAIAEYILAKEDDL